MEKPQLSTEFMKFFNEKILPEVDVYLHLSKVMSRMKLGEVFTESSPDYDVYLNVKALPDFYAPYYISLLVNNVIMCSHTGTNFDILNSLQMVSGTLTSESYWQNVWINFNHDPNSPDALQLKKIGTLTTELIKLL